MSKIVSGITIKKQEDDLDKKLDLIASEDLPTANIIVAGITGTGKSTLINSIFGSELAKTGTGKPVTEHIDEYENDDVPIHIWDTVGLELDSENTRNSIQSIKDTIAAKAEAEDQFDRVHAIWYCINATSNRYQGAELDFIKELHSIDVPFIIVLTQCYGSKKTISEFEEQIKAINKEKHMSDISVVRVLAQDYEFEIDDQVVRKAAFGLDDLVNDTLEKLPGFIKSGFIAAQRVCKMQKREECEEILYVFAKAAQEGIWDKVPIINIFTTDDKIKNMFERIGRMYNTFLSDESINKIINESGIDLHNTFWGLVAPIDLVGYSDKIKSLFKEKKKDGFKVKSEEIPENSRAARMIAFYGYTFIDSIEELWEEYTENQLQNVDLVVDNLLRIINRRLRERKKYIKA